MNHQLGVITEYESLSIITDHLGDLPPDVMDKINEHTHLLWHHMGSAKLKFESEQKIIIENINGNLMYYIHFVKNKISNTWELVIGSAHHFERDLVKNTSINEVIFTNCNNQLIMAVKEERKERTIVQMQQDTIRFEYLYQDGGFIPYSMNHKIQTVDFKTKQRSIIKDVYQPYIGQKAVRSRKHD